MRLRALLRRAAAAQIRGGSSRSTSFGRSHSGAGRSREAARRAGGTQAASGSRTAPQHARWLTRLRCGTGRRACAGSNHTMSEATAAPALLCGELQRAAAAWTAGECALALRELSAAPEEALTSASVRGVGCGRTGAVRTRQRRRVHCGGQAAQQSLRGLSPLRRRTLVCTRVGAAQPGAAGVYHVHRPARGGHRCAGRGAAGPGAAGR